MSVEVVTQGLSVDTAQVELCFKFWNMEHKAAEETNIIEKHSWSQSLTDLPIYSHSKHPSIQVFCLFGLCTRADIVISISLWHVRGRPCVRYWSQWEKSAKFDMLQQMERMIWTTALFHFVVSASRHAWALAPARPNKTQWLLWLVTPVFNKSKSCCEDNLALWFITIMTWI